MYNKIQGGYPESNRELTVPHTVVLPTELYPPYYVGVIRTLIGEYQKFRTYLLVNNILITKIKY